MTVRLIQGDCRDVLRTLPDASVHCVVTSPPYFGLRDYGTGTWQGGDPECVHSVSGQVQDNKAHGAITTGVRPGCDASQCHKCGAERVDRQLGLECTPDEFIAIMVAVFRDVRRLLRADGTCWINMGDSYNAGTNAKRVAPKTGVDVGGWNDAEIDGGSRVNFPGCKPKDLCGVPWMLAFALRADGWYLRQDIIWSKPNPMPESVRDRCTKAHEYLFLLSKSSRYYYDADAIAEPLAGSSIERLSQTTLGVQAGSDRIPGKTNGAMKAVHAKGRRKTFRGGGVYTSGRSFDNAADPCNDSIGNTPNPSDVRNKRSVWTIATQPFKEAHFATFPPALVEPCILAGCPVGGTVLDPFGGAGTTGLVADRLQRHAILIELNPSYVELARRRIGAEAPLLSHVTTECVA